jgi:hypothetical protein
MPRYPVYNLPLKGSKKLTIRNNSTRHCAIYKQCMYRITIHSGTTNIKKKVIPVISCIQNTILGSQKEVPWMMGIIRTPSFFLLSAYCFISLQPSLGLCQPDYYIISIHVNSIS